MPTKLGQRTLLVFDYGTKRIGVAVGQELLGSARALLSSKNLGSKPNWQQLEGLLKQWQPDLLLVGLPLNMDDTEGELAERAKRFSRQLHGRFALPVTLVDERLSSFEAKSRHPDWQVEDIDGFAAVVIFETWYAQQAKPLS